MVHKKSSQKLVSKAELARRTGVSPSGINKASKNQLKDALVGKFINLDHESCIAFMKKHALSKQKQPVTGVDKLYEKALGYCLQTGKSSIRHIASHFNIPIRRATVISDIIKATGKVRIKKPKKKPLKKVVNGFTAKNEKEKAASLEKLSSKNEESENEDSENEIEIPIAIEKFADMTLRNILAKYGTDIAFRDFLKAMKSIEDIIEKRIKNAERKGQLVSREIIKKGVIEPLDAIHTQILTDGAKKLSVRTFSMFSADKSIKDIEKYISSELTSFLTPVKDRVSRLMEDLVKDA